MNRRDFIKRTLAGIVGLAITDTVIDKFLTETTPLSDEEFISQFEYMIRCQFNMLVTNPRQMSIITGITAGDKDE